MQVIVSSLHILSLFCVGLIGANTLLPNVVCFLDVNKEGFSALYVFELEFNLPTDLLELTDPPVIFW